MVVKYNDSQKIKAIETYLMWPSETDEKLIDILNRIHMLVIEDTLL